MTFRAVVLVLAMLLSACGGGGTGDATTADETDQTPVAAEETEAVGAAPPETEPSEVAPPTETEPGATEPATEPDSTEENVFDGAADELPSTELPDADQLSSYESADSDLCLAVLRTDVAVQAASDGSDTGLTDQLMAAVEDTGIQLRDIAQQSAPQSPALGSDGQLEAMIDSAQLIRTALAVNPSGDFSEQDVAQLFEQYDAVLQNGSALAESFPGACDGRGGDLPQFCTSVSDMLNLAASDPAVGQPLEDAFAQLTASADQAVSIAPNGDAARTLERFRQFSITFGDIIRPVGFDPNGISGNITDELFDQAYPGFLTDVEDGFNQLC